MSESKAKGDTEKSLYRVVDDLNIRHYPVSAILHMLAVINEKGSMLTTDCDRVVCYGTHELTRKMLKKLQSINLVTSQKNALNEYRWSVTTEYQSYLKSEL